MRPITYRLIRFSPVPASHPDFRPVVTPTMTAPPTAPSAKSQGAAAAVASGSIGIENRRNP